MEFKQTWWDKNLPNRMDEFQSWIGGEDAASKVALRKHVITRGYKSLIDLGCGTATEYFAYRREYPELRYTGVDSSENLVLFNRDRGVPMIHSDVVSVPVEDSSHEVAFSRHVLEHQPSFEPMLLEMVRIASEEAIHVFFIPPNDLSTIVNYNESENLYHNQYNKRDINNFLLNNPKVSMVHWEQITKTEVSLHILIKK